ncbi:MAG: thiamine ABC transporter substrate-binding protein [Propionibacteriaceae bacterium]|jgi:thiamine transport system substrate-binding protein|nr:thiamine ABC transporter substrate-binding protein [Propionibacteriaceae bacterium]
MKIRDYGKRVRSKLLTPGLVIVTALALNGCSTGNNPNDNPSSSTPTTLTVVTHGSFSLSEETKAAFEASTGIKVTYLSPADGGTLVSELILTKDAPLGDVVFGIDNTFAGRAIAAGVLQPYQSANLPVGIDAILADGIGSLTPIDYGDVCLNADIAWYEEHAQQLPATFEDLIDPAYSGQLVVTNPALSSPGLAFLSATVGAFGENGYLDFWRSLAANGMKVASSWTQAYTVEFSGSSGHGYYPLVLSYATSPMYEEDETGVSATVALPGMCFRQVEYAGIIAGAQNPEGAQKFIDFLLTQEVQETIPDEMYMAPVNPTATLPAAWSKYVSAVTTPINVPTATIAERRDAWIQAWTETVLG